MIRAIDLQRLVNLYGEELTLISRTYGAYDPATGEVVVTELPSSVIGYQASYDLAEIDGTNVIRGDRKVIFGNSDVDGNVINPEVDDYIEGLGDTVVVRSVSKIMSGGSVVCYICQVRE